MAVADRAGLWVFILCALLLIAVGGDFVHAARFASLLPECRAEQKVVRCGSRLMADEGPKLRRARSVFEAVESTRIVLHRCTDLKRA